MHLAVILSQDRFSKEVDLIVKGQQDIQRLFEHFYQAIQFDEDNWGRNADYLIASLKGKATTTANA